MKLEKAISYHQLTSKKFKTMELSPEFSRFIGTPERRGAWLIFGNTGNGKTRFALQLLRELTQFTTVAYNTIEEGMKLSFQRAVMQSNLKPVANRFIILPGDNLTQLRHRLSKHKSPNIIFIDSLQYFKKHKSIERSITSFEYKQLIEDFPTKLFIFLSHAVGKEPKGATANAIIYDADVKIRVEGYKAFAVSRFGGDGGEYVIWREGAEHYWKEEITEYRVEENEAENTSTDENTK